MSFIYFEEKHIDHKRADVLSLKKMINLSLLSRAPELCNGLDIDRYVFELLRQMSEQKMKVETHDPPCFCSADFVVSSKNGRFCQQSPMRTTSH